MNRSLTIGIQCHARQRMDGHCMAVRSGSQASYLPCSLAKAMAMHYFIRGPSQWPPSAECWRRLWGPTDVSLRVTR